MKILLVFIFLFYLIPLSLSSSLSSSSAVAALHHHNNILVHGKKKQKEYIKTRNDNRMVHIKTNTKKSQKAIVLDDDTQDGTTTESILHTNHHNVRRRQKKRRREHKRRIQKNNDLNYETSIVDKDCFYCHLLHPEIMFSDQYERIERSNKNKNKIYKNHKNHRIINGIVNDVEEDDTEDEEVHCLHKLNGSSLRHPLTIELSFQFRKKYRTTIENGDAHVCIYGGQYTTQQHHRLVHDDDDDDDNTNTNNNISSMQHHNHNSNVPSSSASSSSASSSARASWIYSVHVPDENQIVFLHKDHPIRQLQTQSSWSTSSSTTMDSSSTSINNNSTTDTYHFGTKRLLAIRVITAHGKEQPIETLDDIEGAIFGTGRNPQNLSYEGTVVGQYKAVSHGNLLFTPAIIVTSTASSNTTYGTTMSTSSIDTSTTTNTTRRGVLQIELPEYITTFVNQSIREYLVPEILKATENAIGVTLDSVADYFVFCIPNYSLLRSDPEWTAFTYLFERYSYYQESRCTRLSVVMHEMGHGLGFKHSGRNGNEYADKSGYMGYAVNFAGYPRKAFNGHKHWLSGWFSDRTLDIQPWMIQRRTNIRLAAFVDYGVLKLQKQLYYETNTTRIHDYQVIVRINENLYVQYNLADDYNIDTDPEHANKVTAVEAVSNVEVSDLKASLGISGKYLYTIDDYTSIVIHVCGMDVDNSTETVGVIRYADVSIYYIRQGDSITDESVCSYNENDVTGITGSNDIIIEPTSSPITAANFENVNNTDEMSRSKAPAVSYPEILGIAPTVTPSSMSKSSPFQAPATHGGVLSSPTSYTNNVDTIEIEGENSETATEMGPNVSRTRSLLMSSLIAAIIGLIALILIVLWLHIRHQKKGKNNSTSTEVSSRPANSTKKVLIPDNNNLQGGGAFETKTIEHSTSRSSTVRTACSIEDENIIMITPIEPRSTVKTIGDARFRTTDIQKLPNSDNRMKIVSSPTKVEAYISKTIPLQPDIRQSRKVDRSPIMIQNEPNNRSRTLSPISRKNVGADKEHRSVHARQVYRTIQVPTASQTHPLACSQTGTQRNNNIPPERLQI